MKCDRKKRPSKKIEADLAEVNKLKAKGMSHAAIARHLGISKNVVSGIVFRAQNRGDEVITKTHIAAVTKSHGNWQNVISLPVLEPRPIALGRGKPSKDERLKKLLESGKPGTCQWIEGEASTRNFCGAPCRGSWCETHIRRGFVPWKPSANQVSSISPLRVGHKLQRR